ncbi:MAG: VOC family protein [Variovorax sp.]|nr:MAG: VOC family protein [Variovorax sp.]
MSFHLRIARPSTDLARSVKMYCEGLQFRLLGEFKNHQGFDGVMLGNVGAGYHLEFTSCPSAPVQPSSTPEDLLVFYVPEQRPWEAACQRMTQAGFREVIAHNPYWRLKGQSFEDADGYRVVLQNDGWDSYPTPA